MTTDPSDALSSFLSSSAEDRAQMVERGEIGERLQGYLGPEAYDEYRALTASATASVRTADVAVKPPPNLVFVPGVMGSLLKSNTLGGIWWIDLRTRGHLNDLRLAPDGSVDANPQHQIVPVATDIQYEPFFLAAMERRDFSHTDFHFDWRKPLAASTSALKDRIVAMHAANGGQPIHLVGHSMGGLMIRATLSEYGDEVWPRLGRIVFIGTPHYGAPVIASYLKHHFWGFDQLLLLAKLINRATVRSLWGVLGLLPAPAGIYPGTRDDGSPPWDAGAAPGDHPCADFDLYSAEAWDLDLTPDETARLQHVLDGAAALHQQLFASHQSMDADKRDRMAVIAGVGYKTVFRVRRHTRLGFGKHVKSRIEGNPHREGDARVPLASAALEDVSTRYVRTLHSGMANAPAVYEGVFNFLNGQDMNLPKTPQEALTTRRAAADFESTAPHLDGSSGASPSSDEPPFLDEDPPDQATLHELLEKLDRDQLPGFTRVRPI